MPLARAALYAEGPSLHVAIWPGSVGLTEDITRFIAKEGRCFVLSAGNTWTQEAIAEGVPYKEEIMAKRL